MTITQLFNAITGISSFTLAICLTVMLWRSRHVRLQLAAMLSDGRRHIMAWLFASLWIVPVLMALGSVKVLFYASTSYTSPVSTALTGLTAGVAAVAAVLFVRNLLRLMAHDQ